MAYKRGVVINQNGQAQETILSDEQLGKTNGGGSIYNTNGYQVRNCVQYCDGLPQQKLEAKRLWKDNQGRQMYGTSTCYNWVEVDPKTGNMTYLA